MPTDVPAQRIWEAALGRLQLAVPRPSFDTWLRDTEGVALGENTLAVRVPTAFTAAWLEQRLHGLIEDTVSTVAREQVSVSFHVHGA
ncbi:MAG: DnaA N-terminal domain-containing protein, partial [Dehalococcoidia bacterium]